MTPARQHQARDDMDLVDYIQELTRTHSHAEHYDTQQRNRDGSLTTIGRNHNTRVPPLLVQLVAAAPSGAVDERDNSGYESRPTIRVDALDTLARIDEEAARWVRWLGHDDPGDRLDHRTGVPIAGSGTVACVRLLGSLAPSLDRKTRGQLLADVRRWWTWSRIISGWDSASWRPDNTCPMCGERRTLRINLAAEVAFCVEDQCRETWDASNIGLLADHIRAESEAERLPVVASVPCQCRWPQGLREQGRWGMCPMCGSPSCVNAERVAEAEDRRRRAALVRTRLEQLGRRYGDSVRGKVS